jgi:hypothetical protein
MVGSWEGGLTHEREYGLSISLDLMRAFSHGSLPPTGLAFDAAANLSSVYLHEHWKDEHSSSLNISWAKMTSGLKLTPGSACT